MILFITLMSACSGGNDCDTCTGNGQDLDGDGVCDTCGDDTGNTPGTAIVNMAALRLGVEEDCLVNLTGKSSYVDASSTDIEVAAPDTYLAVAGDSAYTAQFGFPVHVDQDGEYWAAEPQEFDVQSGDVVNGTFHLFNLFEPGNYACSYDKYKLDLSASDYKGEYQRTVEFDPVYVAVNESGKVEPEDEHENWDVVGSAYDYLQAEDDHLNLVVVDDEVVYITESEIGKQNFSLTVVGETFGYTADLICSQ